MKKLMRRMDFSKTCRLCLSEKNNDSMQSIYNNTKIPNLYEEIWNCVNIKVLKDSAEESPNNVCDDCFKQIQCWMNFKAECLAADIRLKTYLQNGLLGETASQENSCHPYDSDTQSLDDDSSKHSEEDDTANKTRDEKKIPLASKLKNGRKKKLRTKVELRAAYREKYNQYQRKTYPCDICDKKFTRFCDLFNHDKIDHEELPRNSMCNVCGKLFVSDSRVQIHKSRYHCEKPFTCDMCDKKFLTKRTLQKHIIIHNKYYTCPYCSLSTSSNSSLVEHIRVHTREKPFTCDECGNSYISQQGLNSHKKTHSSEKLFMCDICGYSARNQSSIYIHKGSHSNVKAFICETCGKGFKSKIRLNEHHRRHTAVKRFTCDTCNMSFKQNYQLIKHLRVHSGEKPFTCETCNKSFARGDSLKEHKRIHTGEKRYTCEVCLKAFSFLKPFKTHKCKST